MSSLYSMLQSSIIDQPWLARRMISGSYEDMVRNIRRPAGLTCRQFEAITASWAVTPPVFFGSGVSQEQMLYLLYKMSGKVAAREFLQLASLGGDRVDDPQIITNLLSFIYIGEPFLYLFFINCLVHLFV
jgi:hypothetical protein